MSTLAIRQGKPVRSKPFTAWPVFDATEEAALLKVLRSVSNETYFEDGALVNHTLVEIRDLEK